ncbi:TPA: hypothetical protein DCL37_02915 [Candidatus Acetothermia bacterium]|nr:hypothetical protein [Candidatus Acetothermia bacterium]
MKLNAKRDTSVRGMRTSLVEKAGEWLFALFLFAGYYKADPRLAFIQTHIDITVLFWVLSFCAFLYRILKKPSTSKIPERFAIVAALFLILVVCLVGSLLYSESTQYGYDKTLRFIVLTGWAFFGAGFLISDILSLKRFSWAIAAISVAMAIDALTGYVGVGRIGFVTAFGSNYIALARTSGLGLLATVAFLLPTERTPLMKLALWGIAALQLWGALSAGARGPVIALILSLVLFFALSARGLPSIRIERYALRLGVVMLAALVILGIFGGELFSTLMFRTQVLISEGGTSALTRFGLYHEAFDLWARSPIWGNGIGGFGIAVTGQDVREYPHNIILELGAETGLIGVLIFVTMLIVAFAKPVINLSAQRGLTTTVTRYLLVACCFALLNAMVSGDINDNRMLFTWIALVASVSRFQKGEAVGSLNLHSIGTYQAKDLAEKLQKGG